MPKRKTKTPIRHGRYVNLVKNAGFKAAFSRNKTALMALINYFLPEDRKIVRIIAFEDREVPGFTKDNRTVQVDIRCRDVLGRQFIVEMQNYPQDAFFS